MKIVRLLAFLFALTLLSMTSNVLPAFAEDTTYVVQWGDTLGTIAQRFDTTIEAIANANGIINPNLIYAGQTLTIPDGSETPPPPDTEPDPPAPPSCDTTHTVQPSENLFRISLRYGLTMQAIANANGISNFNLIYVGQTLIIPSGCGGGTPPDPTPTPDTPPPTLPTSFVLGGQTQTFDHPTLMQSAGMTWVKFQHKWQEGDDADLLAERINNAHAQDFKVLFSITGADHSAINFAAYTDFLGEVASLSPDAIEVWNEMNIDREWPSGEINADTYVNQMLKPAYQKIKASNPDVMVISGAPAPTGFFGGVCTDAGCDDNVYVQAMAAAGAGNYLDCVGVHYNEGIISPTQTSGDPRGNSDHYTRYFWGMTNTYYNAFGGEHPLCYTELGYLSPEGYGDLPAGFAWASDTSVMEHAQWLSEAVTLAKDSSKIQMVIVFNVDFTVYGDDPQAGYAILRFDGSCPACTLLSVAMEE